jgi:hypothetical protein
VHDRAVGPGGGDELPPAHDRVGLGEERRQHAELGRRQRHLGSPAAHRVCHRIEHHVAHGGRPIGGAALQQGAHARDQLGEVERLGQVVVTARAEARQPVG